eukprot:20794_1
MRCIHVVTICVQRVFSNMASMNGITAKQHWIMMLQLIGVDIDKAYCIAMVYPTLGCLYNAWTSMGNDKKKQKLLLQNTVKIPHWKYTLDQIENGHCEKPDTDIMNCIMALKNLNSKEDCITISSKMSEKIWQHFKGN